MFFQIELLYFIVMIGVFILLVVKKLPAGLALIISSVIGALLSAIISKTEFQLRHFVEGGVAYFNPILLVTCAMIFMVVLQASGALDYISVKIVKTFRKTPSLMLISFMFIIMLPGMITGSTLASVISAGALVGPIMIKLGIPKHKTGAIIAFGAIMGEIAPPVNIPAMLICEAVDMPYRGFTLPLLLLTIPLAIFTVLILGRKHIRKMSLEEVEEIIDQSILNETKWYVTLPIFILLAVIILQNIFPKVFGIFGMPFGFIVATIPGLLNDFYTKSI
jgi:TRAP-type C4-dicarboxylate transport system permease large subunit